jgi:hypothetical protein
MGEVIRNMVQSATERPLPVGLGARKCRGTFLRGSYRTGNSSRSDALKVAVRLQPTERIGAGRRVASATLEERVFFTVPDCPYPFIRDDNCAGSGDPAYKIFVDRLSSGGVACGNDSCQASLRDAGHFGALVRGLKPHGYLHRTAPRSAHNGSKSPDSGAATSGRLAGGEHLANQGPC